MLKNLQLRHCVQALRGGGVVAYPTEGVWGLGCDPDNEDAVAHLLQIKRRSWRKGLILVAADFQQLQPYVAVPSERVHRLMQDIWPGPVSLIVPAAATSPWWLRGVHSGLAVRVSAHPQVRDLCHAFGGAIVSTSANRSGCLPVRSFAELNLRLRRSVDAILSGALGGLDGPTPVIDALTGQKVRS